MERYPPDKSNWLEENCSYSPFKCFSFVGFEPRQSNQLAGSLFSTDRAVKPSIIIFVKKNDFPYSKTAFLCSKLWIEINIKENNISSMIQIDQMIACILIHCLYEILKRMWKYIVTIICVTKNTSCVTSSFDLRITSRSWWGDQFHVSRLTFFIIRSDSAFITERLQGFIGNVLILRSMKTRNTCCKNEGSSKIEGFMFSVMFLRLLIFF